MKHSIQFEEVQQFRQTWLWYLLLSSSLISLIPIVVFTLKGDIDFKEGVSVIGGVLLITSLNLAAFYYTRLEIKISETGIAYRWWPFYQKYSVLDWISIDHIEMRKYSKFRFGYHKDKEFGKVHNVDGTNGYQVVLNNGRKYYFGTQRKLSVESVLRQTGKLKSN